MSIYDEQPRTATNLTFRPVKVQDDGTFPRPRLDREARVYKCIIETAALYSIKSYLQKRQITIVGSRYQLEDENVFIDRGQTSVTIYAPQEVLNKLGGSPELWLGKMQSRGGQQRPNLRLEF